jgi:hypothetical protein
LSNLDAGNLGFIQQYSSFSQFYISGPSLNTSAPSPKFAVGRQVIKSDGVYVEGAIQGMNITFTADTEAARTVCRESWFYSAV